MTIRSDPAGAVVFVDDYEIGTTPVSANFTYYGTRKVRLVKDGCETLTVMQSIPAPWYQIAPIDFVSENLVPGEIRDRREFNYRLLPQQVVPTEQLLGQAEALRGRAQSAGFFRTSGPPPGAFAPPPGAFAPPPGVPGGYPTPGVPPNGGMPVHPLPTGGWRGVGSGEW